VRREVFHMMRIFLRTRLAAKKSPVLSGTGLPFRRICSAAQATAHLGVPLGIPKPPYAPMRRLVSLHGDS
jgi:hypothetical protein